MKTKKVTNLIIIDASSSMSGKDKSVKDGITEIMDSIRTDMKENKKNLKVRTIIAQFSSHGQYKLLLDTKKRKALKNNTIAEDYEPNGMTALYDAIGQTFAMVGKKQDGVFVNILTDGQENDSREYNADRVKELIAKAKKDKWGITFMGTTEEAINSATSLGISKSNTLRYSDSSAGTKTAGASRLMSKNLYLSSVLKSKSKKDIVADNLVNETTTSTDTNISN